ncbi:MAG: site-2 protease family protein [Halobacteria archaeon]|nr:site-2 protease family protein [Halobacteria archaeon]
MVSFAAWLLFGFGLYWTAVIMLSSGGFLDRYNIDTMGPLFLLRTERWKDLLDRLARPKRFWRAYGNLGIAVAVGVMVISFVLLAMTGYRNLVSPPEPSQFNQPENVLVIPGVNDFLPLSMAPEIVAGLAIGIIVHEGGHGIMCRVGDIEVSSMGLLTFAVLPVGAFVEPDEDEVEKASSGSKTRMFAAGVMNNFVLTVIVFVLLALSMTPVQPIDGVGVKSVVEDSPASESGMEPGDIIKTVDGTQVETVEKFMSVMRETSPGETVEIEVYRDGETVTLTPTLSENPRDSSIGFLGVSAFGIADVHSSLASLNPRDWLVTVFLPFGILGSAFPGFTGEIAGFYELTGVAASLGGLYWLIPNLLFWTAWVNFNLGLFNCVPAVPLDGGHILREGAEKVVSPFLGEDRRESVANALTGATAILMFGSLLLMMFGPRLMR